MKKIALASLLITQSYMAANVLAQESLPTPEPTSEPTIAKITVTLGGIEDGKAIMSKFAYCVADGKGATRDAENISPEINWSGAPNETKSYVVIVVDKDVPASFESANKPDKVIPLKFPRQNFYHWVLVDIPPNVTGLFEGKGSNGITQGGKPVGKVEYGINGQNDYVNVYPGTFGGYDGPCPPWNDERQHRYHFIVYALDIPSLELPNPIRGKQAEAVMGGHILAKGEVMGTYSTNLVWLSK